MVNIQEIFDRISKVKRESKDIKKAYQDALHGSAEYVEIGEKLKQLRAKKQQIEASIKQDFNSEFTKLDDFKIDLASDQELLNDAAMTKLMKGETVEVTDEYQNRYEPVFSVKFKKAG